MKSSARPVQVNSSFSSWLERKVTLKNFGGVGNDYHVSDSNSLNSDRRCVCKGGGTCVKGVVPINHIPTRLLIFERFAFRTIFETKCNQNQTAERILHRGFDVVSPHKQTRKCHASEFHNDPENRI
jgi:hypothetical protein